MSRQSSQERVVTITDNTEVLEVIREEQCSPTISAVTSNTGTKVLNENPQCNDCVCTKEVLIVQEKVPMDPQELENILLEKERVLKKEFEQFMEKETNELKDRFDLILQNEQIRASYMLREAHRERQEKISALQKQLECKNLAGLMYVMCTERRRGELQKLKLVEEYTGYIRVLQEILADGQDLILKLSRGFKTAARVDHEWREKMKKIVKEGYNFNGGSPETNQYIFDLPALLKTEASLEDQVGTPEDSLEEAEETLAEMVEAQHEKPWWKVMEGDCPPFVVYGDMAEFQPPERRAVLGVVQSAKTVPLKWKNYVFNEMFIGPECSNVGFIKDEYVKRVPSPSRENQAMQTDWPSRTSMVSARDRMTATSIDVRGNMGSILKIITSNVHNTANRANLLAARDSMEIASTTKLRERRSTKNYDPSKDKIRIGNRMGSKADKIDYEKDVAHKEKISLRKILRRQSDKDEDATFSLLGSIHNDSLEVIPTHMPDKDHKINYEKVCPMDKCKRMQMDSFVRTLPSYMRESPFTHFEQTFEHYETCTPDQLEILRQRITEKRSKETTQSKALDESPLDEWSPDVEGVGVQTSDTSLPPCNCKCPNPTPVSSVGKMFDMADLYPIKQKLNEIRRECFYNDEIQFDRFKVVGVENSNTLNNAPEYDFKMKRLEELKKILKQHSSLLDIFQANTQC